MVQNVNLLIVLPFLRGFWFSMIIFCSKYLALANCDFDVPSEIPIISPISLCEYPSITYKLKTVLYPSLSVCIIFRDILVFQALQGVIAIVVFP